MKSVISLIAINIIICIVWYMIKLGSTVVLREAVVIWENNETVSIFQHFEYVISISYNPAIHII